MAVYAASELVWRLRRWPPDSDVVVRIWLPALGEGFYVTALVDAVSFGEEGMGVALDVDMPDGQLTFLGVMERAADWTADMVERCRRDLPLPPGSTLQIE